MFSSLLRSGDERRFHDIPSNRATSPDLKVVELSTFVTTLVVLLVDVVASTSVVAVVLSVVVTASTVVVVASVVVASVVVVVSFSPSVAF